MGEGRIGKEDGWVVDGVEAGRRGKWFVQIFCSGFWICLVLYYTYAFGGPLSGWMQRFWFVLRTWLANDVESW